MIDDTPAPPPRRPDFLPGLRADQHTLLRAVAAMLEGGAESARSPIRLIRGDAVTAVHDGDHSSTATCEALRNMLLAHGIAVQQLVPFPGFGRIPPRPRCALVLGVSAAALTTAQRCAGLWHAPVIAANVAHAADVPIRLSVQPAPTMTIELPRHAADIATRRIRIDGPVTWSHRMGPPQHDTGGLLIEPDPAGLLLTRETGSTRQVTGPLTLIVPTPTAGEIDGQPQLFPAGLIRSTRASLPLYRVLVGPRPVPGHRAAAG